MNELHRQMYLSALNLDTYMPRWHLPFAPISAACELPIIDLDTNSIDTIEAKVEAFVVPTPSQAVLVSTLSDRSPVNNLIGEFFEVKKTLKVAIQPTHAADILAELDASSITVEPFSISVWRPFDGLMIIDSRNTKLPLPTELLLNNTLRSIFSNQDNSSQEEVLRWPMIENSFVKRTVNDARIELQTWLSVQHESRPIKYLWLMGSNAALYFLPKSIVHEDLLFQVKRLVDSSINALILPSLNELLQKPSDKQKLFSAARHYQLASNESI